MKNALKISFEMLVGSFMAIIHSVIPAIFKTGASTKIEDLYIFTQERLTRNKKNNTGQQNAPFKNEKNRHLKNKTATKKS